MNPKLERVSRDIDKTKGRIKDLQVRLRDLEKEKVRLENEEIIALFRREKLSEDEFSALIRGQNKDDTTAPDRMEGICNEEE